MQKGFIKKAVIVLFLWVLPFLFSLFMAYAALWAMGDHTSEGLRGAYYWFGVFLPVIYVIGAIYAVTSLRVRLLIPIGLLATQTLYFLVDLWY